MICSNKVIKKASWSPVSPVFPVLLSFTLTCAELYWLLTSQGLQFWRPKLHMYQTRSKDSALQCDVYRLDRPQPELKSNLSSSVLLFYKLITRFRKCSHKDAGFVRYDRRWRSLVQWESSIWREATNESQEFGGRRPISFPASNAWLQLIFIVFELMRRSL